ncbi:hypothetical protein ACJX0J_013501, partial [Zea mays]
MALQSENTPTRKKVEAWQGPEASTHFFSRTSFEALKNEIMFAAYGFKNNLRRMPFHTKSDKSLVILHLNQKMGFWSPKNESFALGKIDLIISFAFGVTTCLEIQILGNLSKELVITVVLLQAILVTYFTVYNNAI